MSNAIIVPARYGSTRFPGKPLALLGGISMVARTAKNAQDAADQIGNSIALVETDDDRIMAHCQAENIPCVMTESDLPSGSDRALAAAMAYEAQNGITIDTIVNLQGDAPFTPVSHIVAVVERLKSDALIDVATPYVQPETPFSGTTLVCDKSNRALWFSKNIIPAIRKEEDLRRENTLSPVRRHIGLYAYRKSALERFVSLPVGYWENIEGLEQLRCLENGMHISCVKVEPPQVAISGIDSPEDLARAEALLAQL
jgi:3-deoxy-manno-octulosonate cytidylyltransferase (CMP-KDO synthetase)